MVISGHQSSSELIRTHQWSSVLIRPRTLAPMSASTCPVPPLMVDASHEHILWYLMREVIRVVIRAHQWSSVVISAHQWSSVIIRAHQSSSVVIRGHQWSSLIIRAHQSSSGISSELISGHQSSSGSLIRSSVVIRAHQSSSEHISGHQRTSVVISGHQSSSELIRTHQRSSVRHQAMYPSPNGCNHMACASIDASHKTFSLWRWLLLTLLRSICVEAEHLNP